MKLDPRGGVLRNCEKAIERSAIMPTGSAMAQRYPPGDRPYRVVISRIINAEMTLNA